MERLSAAFQSAIAVLVRGICGAVGQTDSEGSLQEPGVTTCAERRLQLQRDHPTNSTNSSDGGGGGSDAKHSSKNQSCQTDSRPQPEHCEDDKGSERLAKLLQIPTVMTEIVKWLPPKDLIQIRRTCKLWNSVSTKELKETHAHAHALQVKVTGECAGMVKRLGRLATTIKQNQDHPFAKLLLTTSRGSGEKCRLFTRARVLNLFSIWGQQLTHLEIKKCYSSRASQSLYITGLRHILFYCTPALIELKLTWDKSVYRDPEVKDTNTYKELPHLQKLILELGSDFIQLELDLIRSATGLQSLSLGCCDYSTERLVGYMYSNPKVCRSVKELTLSPVREESLKQLIALTQNTSWQLTKVKFDVWLLLFLSNAERMNLITEFLSLHSNHLTELNLKASVGQASEVRRLRVPQMYALEKLDLDTTHPAKVKFDGCPALKTLTLTHVQFDPNAWIKCLAPFSSSPVRELNMASAGDAVESINMVALLATHFPHLNRLTACMRRECLPRVWSAWPMLEVLDITVSVDEDPMDDGETARYMDHELTGIQPADCTLLRESIAKGRIDYEEAMSMKMAAGIADMKRLREFRFNWKRVAGKTQISDVSGYYAFAESVLQRISIKNGVKFSDDCLAAIQQRLGLGSRIEFLK